MATIQYQLDLNSSNFIAGINRANSAANSLHATMQSINRISLSSMGGLNQFNSNFKNNLNQLQAGSVALGNIISNAFITGAHYFVNGIEEVIKKGQKQAITRADINAMAGSYGPELFKQLQQYAATSMFGPNVYKNAQMMLGFGFNPNQIMPIMKSLGEISGGNQDKMGRLTYALSEMYAGDISKRHLRQMAMAGLPMEDLARSLGMSQKQLLEHFKKQTITGQQIADGIKKLTQDPRSRFYERTEKIMSTPAGRLKQTTTNWEMFETNLGEGILVSEGFKKFLNSLTETVSGANGLMPKLVELGSDFFGYVSGWIDNLRPKVEWILEHKEGLETVVKFLAGLTAINWGMNLASGIGMLSGAGKGAIGTAIGRAALPVAITYISYEATKGLIEAIKGKETGEYRHPFGFLKKDDAYYGETGYRRTYDMLMKGSSAAKENKFLGLKMGPNEQEFIDVLNQYGYSSLLPGAGVLRTPSKVTKENLSQILPNVQWTGKNNNILKSLLSFEDRFGFGFLKKPLDKIESNTAEFNSKIDKIKPEETNVKGVQPTIINVNFYGPMAKIEVENVGPSLTDDNRGAFVDQVSEALAEILDNAQNIYSGRNI